MFGAMRRFVQVRLLVLVILGLSLATGGMLPVWAQLAGIEGPHVCQCSTDHHDCVCAHCGTDPDAHRTALTLKGRCGDDEVAFGGHPIVAVVPVTFVRVLAADVSLGSVSAVPLLKPRARRRPPTPPPRTA